MSTHVETLIIGGGQAGLATGYHLAQRGRPCVILDAHERVGDSWRRHWTSLRLYSPARYDGLPGMAFPAQPWSYPGKDQVGDFLAEYARQFDLPVRNGVRARRVIRRDDGRYQVLTTGGEYTADNVVLACGTFGEPYRPDFAADLDPSIRQLHSSEYRDPSQVPDGPVLVVGAAHSGSDIAYELAGSHQTILCGRDTGQLPFPIESRRLRLAFPVLWRVWSTVLTTSTPLGRRVRPSVRHHGGLLLRHRRADLKARGVERVTERLAALDAGRPVLESGRVIEPVTVVWCTGFRHDFGWVEPLPVGSDGWPMEDRGVVAQSPGLYVTGLAFQRSYTSMLIGGAGTDAEHVAGHIAGRAAAGERDRAAAAPA